MLGLELVVVLGLAVLVCSLASSRVRLAPAVLLLLCGVLLGFLPALQAVHLPPEIMLLVFLPALLYWESLTTSLREIRSNLRGIVLASTVLVILTAGAVAATAHAFGLPWGPAWVLGAALAPTDATAVGVLARSLPRRTVTVLRAESLVNDGTALVVFGLAVGITVGQEQFELLSVSWRFVLAYGGGALAGGLTALVSTHVRRRMPDPLRENAAMVLTPFVAYLLAESVEASGVVAVVVCGLILSQISPRVVRADTRQQATAFWTLSTFLLSGALFVLVGLEFRGAAAGLTTMGPGQGVLLVGAVVVVLLGVRIAFLFAAAYTIRLLDRRPQQRLRRVSDSSRIVSGLTGFRGAVSLAVALAVPDTLASGEPFPGRDTIVFVTTGVIAATLVLQGVLLPVAARWAVLPPDDPDEERHRAEVRAVEEAVDALPRLAQEQGTDPEVVERTHRELDDRLRLLRAGPCEDDDEPALRHDQQYTALRLALLAHKRATMVRLRDSDTIDDIVLRQLQAQLDVEEVRLSRRDSVE